MMTHLRYLSLALAAGLFTAAPARAQDRQGDHRHDHQPPGHQPGHQQGRGHVDGVRDAARSLENVLESLVEEAAEQREHRRFYQQADEVLRDVKQFRHALKEGVSREHLYRDYTTMDRKLHALLDDGRRLGDRHRGLMRDVFRVQQADQNLHYALSQGDNTPPRRAEVVRRQAEALVAEARQFHRVAHAVLDERQHIVGSIEKLTQATENFYKSLHDREDLNELRRDFAAVDGAWNHVVRDFRTLPSNQHAYLASRAQRLDEIHDRLFQTLGMQGKREGIVVQFGNVQFQIR